MKVRKELWFGFAIMALIIIPVAGAVLLLQGLVEIVRCIVCIRQGSWPSREEDVEEVDVEELKKMVHADDEPAAR